MEIYREEEVIRLVDDRSVIEAFFSHCTVVLAAGGVVKNERDEILFIYRRGKWDLPKGKMNKESGIRNEKWGMKNDEFSRIEALREVKEETGLKEVNIVRKLKPTYHIYSENGHRILKKTFWFEMYAPGDQNVAPQAEEAITDVRWFSINRLDQVLKNTYESLKELIIKYQRSNI